jgi:hypothetical protein
MTPPDNAFTVRPFATQKCVLMPPDGHHRVERSCASCLEEGDPVKSRRSLLAVAASLIALIAPASAAGTPPEFSGPRAVLLTTGLGSGAGSTIGPDGALYVTQPVAGRISRVDPRTGRVTTFAEGLPPAVLELGGVMDVAFLGRTAYALVTLVGPDVGGDDVVGIYRIDGRSRFTVVADLGAFSAANPPDTEFFVPSGLQYALQSHQGGFLVTDGHHNRVLRVTPQGRVTELIAFGNVVPTGLDVHGRRVYVAEAGPVPHLPADGRIVSFGPGARRVVDVASGGRLLVDVEFGQGRRLYALAQGTWPLGGPDGSPALPDTGQLLKVIGSGTFAVVVDGLDRPTALEIIGNTAYIVTLDGEVWRVRDLSR